MPRYTMLSLSELEMELIKRSLFTTMDAIMNHQSENKYNVDSALTYLDAFDMIEFLIEKLSHESNCYSTSEISLMLHSIRLEQSKIDFYKNGLFGKRRNPEGDRQFSMLETIFSTLDAALINADIAETDTHFTEKDIKLLCVIISDKLTYLADAVLSASSGNDSYFKEYDLKFAQRLLHKLSAGDLNLSYYQCRFLKNCVSEYASGINAELDSPPSDPKMRYIIQLRAYRMQVIYDKVSTLSKNTPHISFDL